VKKIMENWRRVSQEDSDEKCRQIVHEHILAKMARTKSPTLINEATLAIGGEHGLQLNTEFTKWAAISGIATTICVTAVEIAGFSTPWAAFLLSTLPAAAAIIASPAGLFITGALIMRFAWTRKLAGAILTWLGGDVVKSAIAATKEVIAKIVAASNGELNDTSAWELFRMLATEVMNNEEFRTKLVEFQTAIKEKNEQVTAILSAELDDLVEKIVRQDILQLQAPEDGAPIVASEETEDLVIENMKEILKTLDTYKKT